MGNGFSEDKDKDFIHQKKADNVAGSNIYFFGEKKNPTYKDTSDALKFLRKDGGKVKPSKSIDKTKWTFEPPLNTFDDLDSYRYNQLLLRGIKDDKFGIKKLSRQAFGIFEDIDEFSISFVHRVCPFCHTLNRRFVKYGFEDGWIRIEGSKHTICSNQDCGRVWCFICLRTDKCVNSIPPKKLCDEKGKCEPFNPRISPFALFNPQTAENEHVWSVKSKSKNVTEEDLEKFESDSNLYQDLSSPNHFLNIFQKKKENVEEAIEAIKSDCQPEDLEENEEYKERMKILGNFNLMIENIEEEMNERKRKKMEEIEKLKKEEAEDSSSSMEFSEDDQEGDTREDEVDLEKIDMNAVSSIPEAEDEEEIHEDEEVDDMERIIGGIKNSEEENMEKIEEENEEVETVEETVEEVVEIVDEEVDENMDEEAEGEGEEDEKTEERHEEQETEEEEDEEDESNL